MHLKKFYFPSDRAESNYIKNIHRTCYESFYPFSSLVRRFLTTLDFAPITLLSGGNGVGKTTALNIMAEKLDAKRYAIYNRSHFYDDYLALCDYQLGYDAASQIEMIASDDVFDFLLSLREVNQSIDEQRHDVMIDYTATKYAKFKLRSLDDYDQLKKINNARRLTQSKYIRENLMDNVATKSNGESAFLYFAERIKPGGLYFLDEPENSLSPNYQQELVTLIKNAARFDGCQFIIASHSPFILAIDDAILYDFNAVPVVQRHWSELDSIKRYFDFFSDKRDYFND